MMLVTKDLFKGIIRKVDIAIDRIRSIKDKYYLAFSGGKDSIVIKALANLANVKYDAHYSVTTIDPPDLIYFIRKHHKDVIWEHPKESFLKRMVHKGFPQRQRRWCCAEYKETGGTGRIVMTGIRAAESPKRAKRKMIETCYKDTTKSYMNAIFDWSDQDVWQFIRENNIPYCDLYDKGFKRLGCLFCPMASSRMRKYECKLYPGYEYQFRRHFQMLYDKKKSEGKISVDRWKDGNDMFNWWIEDSREKVQESQGVLFE